MSTTIFSHLLLSITLNDIYIFGHKLKQNSIAGKTNTTTLGKPTKGLKGKQDMMPIWGRTFQVATKLLRVTTKPLTCQTKSNSLRTS